ncbi:SIMPL domain-containing protein [Sphingomonas sinipercae]|uniref:SIMPL domain-containing protein n=2 Tax=Sphingomonas sinipercae TaxID=2714944 RepID=A0A6G7ZQG4_9SPHN|nr:SIMPL domain-containing protein [Sphingomonas sinipercae]
MKFMALALASVALSSAAAAEAPTINQSIAGTRLDVSASGEVTRVPDIAVISAGVVTRAPTASAAIRDNATRMERVIAALRAAGIAEGDIQTTALNLNPDYRYPQNQPPQLTGYSASNQVTIRFRDVRNSGKILDTLVAQGANQINGPTLTVDKPGPALDEARAKAVAVGRARADQYARALGLRVVRVVSVSESGGHYAPPQPMAERDQMAMAASKTEIVPGEQKLQVNLAMVFELQ